MGVLDDVDAAVVGHCNITLGNHVVEYVSRTFVLGLIL
jgi:hypothetical protein